MIATSIRTTSDGMYQGVSGARLLKETIVKGNGGLPVLIRVWDDPARGIVTQKFAVDAERSAMLIYSPMNGAQIGPRPADEIFPDANPPAFPGGRVEDKRSVPRPGRTTATTEKLVEQGAANPGDRRTGGPIKSAWDEVCAFAATPAGKVVGVVILAAVVIRVWKGKSS